MEKRGLKRTGKGVRTVRTGPDTLSAAMEKGKGAL